MKIKYILRLLILLLLVMTLFFTLKSAWEHADKVTAGHNPLVTAARQELNRQMSLAFMPVFSFVESQDSLPEPWGYMQASLSKQFPVYYYAQYLAAPDIEIEDMDTRDLLIMQEGRDENSKNIDESDLDYQDNALHIESSLANSMLEENNRSNDDRKNTGEQPAAGTTIPFTAPGYPSFTYDWSESWEYETIIANFYAVDSTTAVSDDYINLKALLSEDMTIDKSNDAPQILIYHTHSQEAFADSIPGDPATTIVGAGSRLAAILEEEYGFRVLHHTGEYDVESRDYAYTNALPEIEQLLKDHPTIEVVIDLHRDAMREDKKLVMDLQGRPTARFMFFNGLSYTRQAGEIASLPNPYISDNLALSFQAQVAANEYYPGIARKIYLKAYRYNMHLMDKTLLIELGAQNNTVEEIMNACEPLAHILSLVLSGN